MYRYVPTYLRTYVVSTYTCTYVNASPPALETRRTTELRTYGRYVGTGTRTPRNDVECVLILSRTETYGRTKGCTTVRSPPDVRLKIRIKAFAVLSLQHRDVSNQPIRTREKKTQQTRTSHLLSPCFAWFLLSPWGLSLKTTPKTSPFQLKLHQHNNILMYYLMVN